MNREIQTSKYLVWDYVSAGGAWCLFYFFRKRYIEHVDLEYDSSFFFGVFGIPFFWIIVYALFGLYKNIYRRYRLKEIKQVFSSSFFGVIFLFFALLLDDMVSSYKQYYLLVSALFGFHFALTVFGRLFLTAQTVKKIHKRKIGFNTLIIGGNKKALKIYDEIENLRHSTGNRFVGFVSVNGVDHQLGEKLNYFGKFLDVRNIIQENQIKEVIIAIESSEHEAVKRILNKLEGIKVRIKIIPDMYDILTGSVRMTSIMGAPLIEIKNEIMPEWQIIIKRLMDIIVSILVLIILSPLYLTIALLVRSSSKGPIFYSQERIGIYAKPFTIYKFRSMRTDAESNGPQLASENDKRTTKIGKFLRQTRLDEFPQFYNVLRGDMSLVGPRPERQFFIDQIIEKAPHYKHLQKVKPGITSWGQVKYGYASNVDEMIQRLKYDILYIENISLTIDFKILFYTILIVIKRDGK